MDFKPFPKVPRLSREIVITEKLDGTNASVWIEIDHGRFIYREHKTAKITHNETVYTVSAGSRKKFLSPGGTLFTGDPPKPVKGTDNFGFAAWFWSMLLPFISLPISLGVGAWVGYATDQWWTCMLIAAGWGLSPWGACIAIFAGVLAGRGDWRI